jgi:arylsulfatase A
MTTMNSFESFQIIKKAASFAGMLLFGNAMFSGSGYAQNTSPNFIFILTDDLGWSHTSRGVDAGNPDSRSDYYSTPSIDRLIQDGISFTRGYAPAAICSPTRRSIQYGKTPARLGDDSFKQNYDPGLGNDILSIPMVLKAANPDYRAAHYGKWDLRAGIFPEDVGYDESDGDTGNRHGNHFIHPDDKWNMVFITNDPKRTVTLADRSVNFMERQTRNGHPFFLQISHYAPHVDIQARRDTYDKYLRKPRGKKHNNAGMAAMIEDLDSSVGIILDKVRSLGIEDNTYIIFMSDNGPVEAIPQVRPATRKLQHPDKFPFPLRSDPLRAGKWTLYEGGIRVPFIVKGPGIAPESMSHEPVAGWDILPTLAELAQYPHPLPRNLDGGSFAGILKSGGEGAISRDNNFLVFHRYHDGYGHSAIMHGDFKLMVFWIRGHVELYNITDDLGERHDLALENPEKVNELLELLKAYLQEVNPDLFHELKHANADRWIR